MIPFSTIFLEAVIFALYVFICLTLLKPRSSKRLRGLVCGGAVLCSFAAAVAVVFLNGIMTALTLLPLIAYLPFSICVYVLSENSLFETVTACSMGVLCSLIVKTVKKLIYLTLPYTVSGVMTIVVSLLLAGACGAVVYKFIGRTFSETGSSKNRALVMIPVSTVLLMILYNFNRTLDVVVTVSTLVLAVSIFVIVLILFAYMVKIADAAETEKRLSESLEMQRKNFEQISQNIDAGRIYRHDMRHHLRIISGMAQQNNSTEIMDYINKLNESAELGAAERVCQNPAVNSVMTEYINRAKKLGCRTEYKLLIPEALPFSLPDVCVILSNALENALNACEKCPEDKRYINILADFSDDRKLKIIVKNSCADLPRFDEDGLPVVKRKNDGHGIGLHGVKKTVEKYNGFVHCACENGEFLFCAEIFRAPTGGADSVAKPASKYTKAVPAVLTALVCAAAIPNISPVTAQAMSNVLSINIKTIDLGWGDNSFEAEYPEFTGENTAELNSSIEELISEARNIFNTYINQKFEGYVAEDVGYDICTDNDKYLSVRFFATLNLGGSFEFTRCVTLDKESGNVMALANLFDENYDYITKISEELLRQMAQRVKDGHIYFIPGGIWSEDECFKTITPEQNFYISADGELVITFDEYVVAPGTEGAPEFVMPSSIFDQNQ